MTASRRRFLLACAAAAAAQSCAPADVPEAAAPAAPAKADAFALIGDRYHNSDYIRTGLNRTIAEPLGVSIDFCDETKRLTADTLEGYRLLKPCRRAG